jgi:phage-related baseplate assembly protein
LTLRGITTDGSALSPTPLAEVFDGVPHQRCQFQVVKDIVKAVLQAVSSERKRLAAKQPQ